MPGCPPIWTLIRVSSANQPKLGPFHTSVVNRKTLIPKIPKVESATDHRQRTMRDTARPYQPTKRITYAGRCSEDTFLSSRCVTTGTQIPATTMDAARVRPRPSAKGAKSRLNSVRKVDDRNQGGDRGHRSRCNGDQHLRCTAHGRRVRFIAFLAAPADVLVDHHRVVHEYAEGQCKAGDGEQIEPPAPWPRSRSWRRAWRVRWN